MAIHCNDFLEIYAVIMQNNNSICQLLNEGEQVPNSLYPNKADLIIHLKYFPFLKEFCHFTLCFSARYGELCVWFQPVRNGEIFGLFSN